MAHGDPQAGTATISAHGSFAGKVAAATGGGSGMGRQLFRQLAGRGCSVAADDWHKDTVADGAARAQAGAGPGVRVTGQAGDVSGEAQVLRFGDEPVMVPIQHLASTVPAHTWTFRPGRAWTPARPIWARRAPWLPNGVPGDCGADPARRVPALGMRSRAVHRARVRGDGPVPADREG
jgi:hypothetical protein